MDAAQLQGDWPIPLSLPAWLPDETLFSWASRYHRRTCNALARATALQLFGHPHGGTAHDLPCGLDLLVARTKGRLGGAEELARQRTLLPFYLPSRDLTAQTTAIAVLRGDRLRSLKYQLGMLTSGFRAHHPLKACPVCAQEARTRHGEAYWRREHQWPGVWVCLRHRVWLSAAQVKRDGIRRFLWVLPDAASLQPAGSGLPPSALYDLAVMVNGWCALPAGFVFDQGRLVGTLRRELVSRGWTRGQASLKLAAIRAEYGQWSRGMEAVPDLVPLGGADHDVGLVRVLRGRRGGVHPLRHLAVIAWLFADWESFCTAYCSDPSSPTTQPSTNEAASSSDRRPGRRAQLISLLASMTLRQAAVATGVAVATAQRWATQAGIVVARRPQRLVPPLRKRVITALRRGHSQTQVAAACGIPVALVGSVLRTEVGLSKQWRMAVTKARGARARAAWTALRKRLPAAGRKALRDNAPAAFAYLYRHDRDWLSDNLPLLGKRQSRQLRLDWTARDAELCDAVQAATVALRKAGVTPPIPLWRICQRVPALRPKLRYLNRLPRTDAQLRHLRSRVVSSRPAARSELPPGPSSARRAV